MKKYFKTAILLLFCLSALILQQSCEKGLDYKNTATIVPDNVWKDPIMIKAFLTDIYGGLNPGWSFDGGSSDEGISTAKSLGNYQRGIVTVDNTNASLNYTYIDKANYFLDKLQTIPTTILPADLNKRYTGEAKFWRAWTYWGMVKNVGGVPLILHTQNVLDRPSLKIARNKTSECIAQIVKDLDSAILLLPASYTGADYGRITSVAAKAFKGRVLLWYASPLFNTTNVAARWQAAYDANKDAVDFATAQGAGLYANFRNIWYKEQNKEVIMVHQYYYPDHPVNFNSIRPEPLTKDASNNNQPLLSLLLSFPKKDGSPMQFDKTQLSDPTYNAQFMTDFYTNRDNRFYATIAYGGVQYPTPDLLGNQGTKTTFWNAWKWDAANNKYVNILPDVYPGAGGNTGLTGFFDRKGLDTTVIAGLVGNGQTDWIEIRYAEVLMNYGECANELGKTSEALNVLYQIRARAGIAPGANNTYGITATTQADIRTAYINERQVEFAFENKRLPDLRRWKRYDLLNSQGARHGLYLTINTGSTVLPTETIMSAVVRAKFKFNYIDNLDGDAAYKFALDLTHWFYALPPAQITKEPTQLPQNIEWGGTFDPTL